LDRWLVVIDFRERDVAEHGLPRVIHFLSNFSKEYIYDPGSRGRLPSSGRVADIIVYAGQHESCKVQILQSHGRFSILTVYFLAQWSGSVRFLGEVEAL